MNVERVALVLLGIAVLLACLPLVLVGIRKVLRLLRNGGEVRWVYLAWALLLASTLVWSAGNAPSSTSLDEAGGGQFVRLAFLVLGTLVTLIIAAKRNLAFVGYLAKAPVAIFFVFALWGLTSTLWSVLPSVTIYKEFEYLAVLLLVATVVSIIRSRSVAKTSHERLLRVKNIFDWHWLLIALMLLSVYVAVLLWPSRALEPSIGLLSFQLQGVSPRIATNSVGELGAILGTVALVRLLNPLRTRAAGSRAVYALVLAGSLVTLILAQSRSPIIGALLAAVVVALASRRIFFLLALALISAVLVFNYGDTTYQYLARGQDESDLKGLSSRVNYWEGAATAIRERPLAGYGAYAGGRYLLRQEIVGEEKAVSSLHNSYMETLVGTGAVGLTILVTGLGTTWVFLFRLRRRAARYPVGRLLWIESVGIFTVLSVRSMFSTPFIWTNVLTFGLLLIYLTVLGGERERALHRSHAGASPAQPLPAARR